MKKKIKTVEFNKGDKKKFFAAVKRYQKGYKGVTAALGPRTGLVSADYVWDEQRKETYTEVIVAGRDAVDKAVIMLYVYSAHSFAESPV